MRRRYRRNVTNYLTAAMLELILLAAFVVIAHPQLRQKLLDAVSPHAHASAQDAMQVPLENSANLASNAPATPLIRADWNVAAAAQSPLPLSGWTPAPSAETAYREIYPPPFGTQSPWQ